MPERLAVIGGDAAGMSAAARLKRRKPGLALEVFEQGDFVSYGACGIPYFIGGEVKALTDLVVVTAEEFILKRGIPIRLRHRVEKILPDQKRIQARDLMADRIIEATYDHLLIATGARPIIPANLDLTLPGVFALRGLAAADQLKNFIREQSPRTAVIVGAGYIGLEMAEALTAAGLQVTLIEFMPRVIPAMEEEISAVVQKTLTDHGVEVILGAGAEKLERGERGGIKVSLSNGQMKEADLVLVAIGVTPNSELARDAGIELGAKGAIKVDRRQRTSAENIFAAGDCAEAYHLLLRKNVYVPLALAANRQGRVVADHLAGTPTEFPGILGTAVTRIFNLAAARTGLGLKEAQEHGLELEKVIVRSKTRAHYYPGGSQMTLVLLVDKTHRSRLLGAQMAGADGVPHRINTFATALAAGLTLDQIMDLDLAYAPPFSPVFDPVLQAAEQAMKK